MNKYFFILIVSFVTVTVGFSQENSIVQVSEKVQQNDILERLSALENSQLKDFLAEMQKISKLSSHYIQQKSEECSGVYSTITTNERGEQIEQKKKLSLKEKKLCKYLLINFQIQLAQTTYKLRTQYLKQQQQDQLDQLEKLSKKRLAELESLAAKYK